MFLRIEKEKVKYVAILNGEPILIKIESISSDGNLMTIKTTMYVESEYLEFGESAERGYIFGLNNTFIIDLTETAAGVYTTVASKLVKNELITMFDLLDTDITILAEIEWRDISEAIRLTIPIEQVIENPFYRSLMETLITANTIYYKVGENYVLYLAYILPEHRPILDADPNLIIEE